MYELPVLFLILLLSALLLHLLPFPNPLRYHRVIPPVLQYGGEPNLLRLQLLKEHPAEPLPLERTLLVLVTLRLLQVDRLQLNLLLPFPICSFHPYRSHTC